ncbi:hypothetical protein [Streptomyces sp. NPDC002547]
MTLLETVVGGAVALAACLAGISLLTRVAARGKAASEGRPGPPLLPEGIPWGRVGVGIAVVLVLGAVIALTTHIIGRGRHSRLRRADLEARHDTILAALGGRIIDDLTDIVLNDAELVATLETARETRANANLGDYCRRSLNLDPFGVGDF